MASSSSTQGRLPLGSGHAAAAVSSWVVFKLLAFTIAMFALPIGTYYATLERVFNGNATYAAGAAAAMVNVIALGYILAASLEDKTTKKSKKE